jgi:soluble lytic murein transglycosylase-like protein
MTDNEKKILFGFGLLGIGVLLFMNRRVLSSLASSALDEANDLLFRSALSTNAQPYADIVRQVAREQGRDPLLLAALVDREDPWWDPNIVSGDGGYGLGQITSDLAWISSADWSDPYTNLTKAAQMLGVELDFFNGKFPDDPTLATQYALAAYNRGRTKVWASAQRGEPPDTGTTDNYATGVWSIYNRLAGTFQAGLGQV